MAKVELEPRGAVAIVRLCDGVINPISPELLADLDAALDEAGGQFRGLVLAGGAKFFSMGFALPLLLKMDRQGMSRFFYAFQRVWLKLYSLPLPTVAAVAGHAVAGGTILALACDQRVGSLGRQRWGLNESRLGVSVPYTADLALRSIVAPHAARDLLYSGRLVGSEEALALGLADELAQPEQVEERALARAADMADLPPGAYAAIKENQTEELLAAYDAHQRAKNERFLDLWFGPPAQAELALASEKF